MKRLLIGLLVAVSALSVVVTEAEAKRMGGGGSFGRQSQGVSRQSAAPMQNQAARPAPAAAAPAAPVAKPASPWRGMLGGALLGLGLGALLSHFGLGGAMASMISTMLMIALLAFAAMFVYRMFKRKQAERDGNLGGLGGNLRPAYGSASSSGTPGIGSRLDAQPAALQGAALGAGAGAAAMQADAPWGVPADFDTTGFLRHAKTYYIRLQAAWDRADINDIREFTTPEMFAETKMQLEERGASPNHTDVMALDATLLGIETVGSDHLASVKFSGMIKEDPNASAQPFAEVWNLSKAVAGDRGWVLAGIQQL